MIKRVVGIFLGGTAIAGGGLAAAFFLDPSLTRPLHAVLNKVVPTAISKAEAGDKSKPALAGTTAASASSIPSGNGINILVRRTLLTLNDANLSGNYTVFHRLAAPGLQRATDSEKLARAFTDLRSRRIDMAPIVNFNPKLLSKPQLTKSGKLRVKGYLPTRPQQINFDMLFEKHGKRWLLFGISVKVAPPKTAALGQVNRRHNTQK